LLLIVGCQASHPKKSSLKLPPPPSGFEWFESTNGVGAFLRPKGWHVRESSNGSTNTVIISKDKVVKADRFKVGLTVEQRHSWSKSNQEPPSQYAKRHTDELAKSDWFVAQSSNPMGDLPDMNMVNLMRDKYGVITYSFNITIGADRADKVYLLKFEAPIYTWDDELKQGLPMLNNFFLMM